jgi:hypothetical protein
VSSLPDGQSLWVELGCISCHGPKGHGRRIPGMRNPDGSLPDVYDLRAALKGGDSLQQIYCAISNGRPGTVMSGHPKIPPKSRWALAALIRRWRTDGDLIHRRPIQRDGPTYQVGMDPLAIGETTPVPSVKACMACHQSEHQGWLMSRHQQAMGQSVIGQYPLLTSAAMDNCNRCHSPNEQWQGSQEGITCIDCHIERALTPNQSALGHGGGAVHPDFKVVRSALTSDSCISCHNLPLGTGAGGKPLLDTWREWAASRHLPAGRQCKDCHMRSGHHMPGAHDRSQVAEALDVTTGPIQIADGVLHLDMGVTNVGAGHHFPTTVTPMAILMVEQTAGARIIPNTTIAWTIGRRVEHRLGRWHEIEDTRIAAGEYRRFTYHLKRAQEADGLVIRLTFFPDWHYVDLLQSLADFSPRASTTRNMLSKAAETADNSAFEIFTKGISLP